MTLVTAPNPTITGGNGGRGGAGISGTGLTITNAGTIVGGIGGRGGAGFPGNGVGAEGGAGISGSNLTITNSGTISGGRAAGGGGARANAITFTGGANSLVFSNATSGLNGNVAVTGTLDLRTTVATTTVASDISGDSLTKSGAGTIILSGTNAVASISVTLGTLVNAGSLTTALTNSATFTNALTFTGTASNSGTFNNNADGTVSGLLTNTGGTATNAGQLNGGVSIAGGTVTNSSTVAGGVTLTGGSFSQTAGTTSGGLSNTNGVVTANGGAINGAIANNAAGVFNVTGALAGNSTFANNGTAQLQVTGGNLTGVTTLTNNSTAATGIGVAAGRTLAATSLVNAVGGSINNLGTITTTSTVNNGTISGAYAMASGTLSGIGNTQNLTVTGGTFAPGSGTAGSSMTVTGSLAFQAAAAYLVQIDPTTSSLTNVTGNATLGGATVRATFAAGAYVGRQYTILHATIGVAGTFGSVANTNLPSGFVTTLSYDAHNAYLNLALIFAPPPGSGLTGNQQNAGSAIVGFFDRTGSIPVVFGGLTPAGLTQISGEAATGSQQTTFNAMTQFMGVMTDPFIAGRGDGVSTTGGASAYAREADSASAYAAIYRKAAPAMADPFAQRWSVWAAAYGGSQTTDGNAAVGSNNVTSRIYGVAAGADYRLSPDTLAGFALAGGGTNFSIANALGTGRSDLFQAGAWLRHNVGAAYLTAALAYGWQDITTDRTVTVAGVDQLRAKFNANAWSGRVEGGYRVVSQGIGFTPYAAGQFVTFQLPNYAEAVVSGANTFALSYAAKEVTASRSELGLRTDKSFAVQDGIFTLRGRAAWAHNFNTDRSVLPTFQALPGASFVVNGASQAADAALATASAEMKWLNGFSVAGTFEGEFSDVAESYAGKGIVRYAW